MILSALVLIASAKDWTIVCGGDIMLNGLVPQPYRLNVVAPLLRNATVSMANLEVPLTTSTDRTRGKSAAEVAARTQYILKADPRQAQFLKSWGFKILTEGNNHAMDYGWKGLSQSLSLLDAKGIVHTGAGRDSSAGNKPAIFRLPNGEHLAVLAALAFVGRAAAHKCTPASATTPGVATLFLNGRYGLAALKREIHDARVGNGPVIIFLHWGVERMPVPTPYQVELGRACIDAGADAVIGAHPHVLQGGELYRGRPILYSLGNLIAPTLGGIGLAELRFSGRNFKSFELQPFYNRGGTLSLGPKGRQPYERRAFDELGARILALYPSRWSEPLRQIPSSSEEFGG